MNKAVENILTIYRALMLPLAEQQQYTKWTEEFARENQERSLQRIADIRVDFSELTDTEATLLGFPLWDKESGIRLIPLWLYPYIASGQKLSCIDGSTVEVDDNYRVSGTPSHIDNDHRGGAIAYGFVPTEGRS